MSPRSDEKNPGVWDYGWLHQNFVNIVAPRSVHVYQIWRRSVVVCWRYSQTM